MSVQLGKQNSRESQLVRVEPGSLDGESIRKMMREYSSEKVDKVFEYSREEDEDPETVLVLPTLQFKKAGFEQDKAFLEGIFDCESSKSSEVFFTSGYFNPP